MMPANAITLSKIFEGYSFKPYICPAGYLTGGFGHMFKPGEKVRDLPLSEAEQVLLSDLLKALSAVIRMCPVLLKDSEKLGAITDFVFNLGGGRLQTSTLRRRINQRDWPEAARELNRWVYGGGKKLRGLVLRRLAESQYLGVQHSRSE